MSLLLLAWDVEGAAWVSAYSAALQVAFYRRQLTRPWADPEAARPTVAQLHADAMLVVGALAAGVAGVIV